MPFSQDEELRDKNSIIFFYTLTKLSQFSIQSLTRDIIVSNGSILFDVKNFGTKSAYVNSCPLWMCNAFSRIILLNIVCTAWSLFGWMGWTEWFLWCFGESVWVSCFDIDGGSTMPRGVFGREWSPLWMEVLSLSRSDTYSVIDPRRLWNTAKSRDFVSLSRTSKA